ncbi:MAG: hypothetical protein F6K17_14085 [Okeania sp. SIO3C4]|nr:hypothetical protein [Okeania sp. SIO3B3]NER03662.1 hypothetical protein [Okeania sp. SIO3C4]
MIFVGTKQLNSVDELRELLTKNSNENSYYFLRWSHKVSGIVKNLPSEFPSSEGQMFNEKLELRWKKNNKGYQILLLSNADPLPEFSPLGKTWKTKLRDAFFYDKENRETRFPRKFKVECPNIAQRYFLDAQTATVHFIALTVKTQND